MNTQSFKLKEHEANPSSETILTIKKPKSIFGVPKKAKSKDNRLTKKINM